MAYASMVAITTASALAGSADAAAFHQTVISTQGLTKPFRTKSKWLVIVTQYPSDESGTQGRINFCFVKRNTTPDCLSTELNKFESLEIIHPSKTPEAPLLVAKTDGVYTGVSGYPIETIVWVYRRDTDRFEKIFSHQSNVSENEETRVIAKGRSAETSSKTSQYIVGHILTG